MKYLKNKLLQAIVLLIVAINLTAFVAQNEALFKENAFFALNSLFLIIICFIVFARTLAHYLVYEDED